MILSIPALIGSPVTTNRLVEFVDIYPTLCELAGLDVPEGLEGISTVPLIDNPDLSWKKAVFSQYLRSRIWLAPDGIAYHGYAIRSHDYLYVEWKVEETGELAAVELYDLQKDPQENKNVAGDTAYADILNKMAQRLKDGWLAALP
jgi:iduronate 2-sulfatase